MSDILQILIMGYVLGSIPFGVLLAKLFRLPDPRYIGSGNIGATNMLRTGNKKVAALTLLLDAGKGTAAVFITNVLFPFIDPFNPAADCMSQIGRPLYCMTETNPLYAAIALLAAALGHMFSPWLRFKGGKGVATLFGGALAFAWPVGMGALLVWIIVCYTTRYVSLASIIVLVLAPLIVWLRVDGESALILAVGSAVAIWKHRENIQRLRRGFEHRLTFSKGKQP